MNKKPLSLIAQATAKKMGVTEDQYRQIMSERSKRASRDNNYLKKLKESDPKALSNFASQGGRLSRSTTTRFTDDTVRIIKERLANGDTGTSIAKDYGVAHSLIYNIKNGKSWKHLN